MPYFRIEAEGATPTTVEAPDWVVAVARYVNLAEFTGWSGDAPLTVSETAAHSVSRDATELLFTEELLRIAMRMLRVKPGRPKESTPTLTLHSSPASGTTTYRSQQEGLALALTELSALKLRHARAAFSEPTIRVAAAFDSGYAALLAIARRHLLPEPAKQPNEATLKAAAQAGGLDEQDVALGMRLMRWVHKDRYAEPATLPVAVPVAVAWAERVCELLKN